MKLELPGSLSVRIGYRLVYLHVLRSRGHCFTFDDLLDFVQVQVLEEIRFRASSVPARSVSAVNASVRELNPGDQRQFRKMPRGLAL